jgi:hypothetical protein
MNWVTDHCNRAMLIEKGAIILEGEPEEVVRIHQERSAQRRAEQKAAGVFSAAKVSQPPVGSAR